MTPLFLLPKPIPTISQVLPVLQFLAWYRRRGGRQCGPFCSWPLGGKVSTEAGNLSFLEPEKMRKTVFVLGLWFLELIVRISKTLLTCWQFLCETKNPWTKNGRTKSPKLARHQISHVPGLCVSSGDAQGWSCQINSFLRGKGDASYVQQSSGRQAVSKH